MSVASSNEAERWIAYRRDRESARLRLFCLPLAGGGASAYRRWATLLDDVDVCPVQPPGRENRVREPALRRMSALVERLDEALAPLVTPPFALFGYSMGATIAYEWAHRLRRRHGLRPEKLIVAARAAPHLPRTEEPMFDLPEAELRRRLADLQGTPPEVLANEELMEMLLPLLRADFEIHDTYRPPRRAPLDCDLLAIGGRDDDAVPVNALRAWSEATRGAFECRLLDGDHFTLLSSEGLPRTIAEALS